MIPIQVLGEDNEDTVEYNIYEAVPYYYEERERAKGMSDIMPLLEETKREDPMMVLNDDLVYRLRQYKMYHVVLYRPDMNSIPSSVSFTIELDKDLPIDQWYKGMKSVANVVNSVVSAFNKMGVTIIHSIQQNQSVTLTEAISSLQWGQSIQDQFSFTTYTTLEVAQQLNAFFLQKHAVAFRIG